MISEQALKKICSSAIYKRGQEYFNQGRVHIKNRDSKGFTAIVDGESLYNVSVKTNDEGEITDYFCTCPYYETMGSVCKHIVAAIEERNREEEGAGASEDLNEKISAIFISDFSRMRSKREEIPMRFDVNFRKRNKIDMICEVVIYIYGKPIDNPEEFLESFASRRPFRISRSLDYHPDVYTFGEQEERILSVLAESYESRSAVNANYIKSSGDVTLGAEGVKRLMQLLPGVDYKIVIDRMDLGRMLIVEENPEVVIDISAVFGEITLYVANYGVSLVPDAGVFYYEGAIFLTDAEWKKNFLPIYRALATDCRSQITFRGENALTFAAFVLPHLEGAPGVITDGLGEYVIKEKPVFTVFLDMSGRNIKSKIKADYGTVSFYLPDVGSTSNYIVVRNLELEEELLSYFNGFSYKDGYYVADDDDVIFRFITEDIEALKELCTVIESDLFSNVSINKSISIGADVRYSPEVHLLEATPKTDLSLEEIRNIIAAVKLKKRFFRADDGEFYDINAIGDELLIYDKLFFGDEVSLETRRLPEYNIMYLFAAASECGMIDISCSDDLVNYINKIKEKKAELPEFLVDKLRDYQKVGTDWLAQISSMSLGGILADDMGLGKTLQMLAFLYGEKREEPVLIVTPSALTYNWLHEFNKFIPDASVVLIDGAKEERQRKITNIEDYDFAIISYPLLRRDIDEIEEKSFSFCILDEAQAIKNPQTMNSTSVKKIKARRRFALTGTPIENSLKELWSIFDFLIPGYLGEYSEFRTLYELPIVRDGNEGVMNELRAKIRPFILRRMKRDVLAELPEKIEEIIYARMTDEQENMYVAYREIAKNRALAILGEDGANKMEILTLILRLRQISCHPALFDASYKDGSGKLDILFDKVPQALQSGHRILIFSQFTSMLNIIAEALNEQNISHFYIDGSTPPKTRVELCNKFNNGEKGVFLISLKAGGTGLNLTGADMVIHFDPWWNPAVTDQASDRAYRIGQERSVHVIRMACVNSIEAKILELQEKKRNLANDIININSAGLSALSNEEIISLFE